MNKITLLVIMTITSILIINALENYLLTENAQAPKSGWFMDSPEPVEENHDLPFFKGSVDWNPYTGVLILDYWTGTSSQEANNYATCFADKQGADAVLVSSRIIVNEEEPVPVHRTLRFQLVSR